MVEIPDNSIHMCVTSPPYNVGKDYEEGQTFEDWLTLCRSVFKEVHRVLVPGGRVCIVVANTGRNPYVPLHYYLTEILLTIGFLMRGEVIWDKGASVGPSTAWGSWLQATNPTLRDVHEYILIFSKDSYRREPNGHQSTISRDEFLECTKSIWSARTASAKQIGHPAPFPLEIPHRLIQLYSFEGDVILDPFMGSGQTAIAALQNGRHFVGYEICADYCQLTQARLTARPIDQHEDTFKFPRI